MKVVLHDELVFDVSGMDDKEVAILQTAIADTLDKLRIAYEFDEYDPGTHLCRVKLIPQHYALSIKKNHLRPTQWQFHQPVSDSSKQHPK